MPNSSDASEVNPGIRIFITPFYAPRESLGGPSTFFRGMSCPSAGGTRRLDSHRSLNLRLRIAPKTHLVTAAQIPSPHVAVEDAIVIIHGSQLCDDSRVCHCKLRQNFPAALRGMDNLDHVVASLVWGHIRSESWHVHFSHPPSLQISIFPDSTPFHPGIRSPLIS